MLNIFVKEVRTSLGHKIGGVAFAGFVRPTTSDIGWPAEDEHGKAGPTAAQQGSGTLDKWHAG